MRKRFWLLAVVFAWIGFAQQGDRFQGVASHDVPHCSPKGGKHSAPCRCLGMVNDVKTARSEQCWEKAGFLIPRDAKGKPLMSMLFSPTAEVMQCLGNVPDHCQVVARGPSYWSYGGKNICRTSCKPERCGCADEACKPHGAGAY